MKPSFEYMNNGDVIPANRSLRLTVVTPTLNRKDLLLDTLSVISDQIRALGVQEDVEFIVADNASDDGTDQLRGEIEKLGARYVRFSDRVPVGQSIARSVSLGSGRFVWVFGDDDLLHPGSLAYVLGQLEQIPDHDMVYFNRLVMDVTMCKLVSIPHNTWTALSEDVPMSEFIQRFNHWPGFISAMVFSRRCFDAGADFDRPLYGAWEFLARIYKGGSRGKARVIYLPLISQRLGVHSWKEHWPRYWLVNMPRMLNDLEEAGCTRGAVATWARREVTLKRVLIDCLVAKSFRYPVGDPFWAQAARWQPGLRRLAMALIRWLVPGWVARLLYRLQPKYKK